MKYIKIIVETPFVGTGDEFYYEFSDDTPTGAIDDLAQDLCISNSESYIYLVAQDVAPEDFDDDAEYEEYLDEAKSEFCNECSYEWGYISKEEYCENMNMFD
jgi:hypothetical protein